MKLPNSVLKWALNPRMDVLARDSEGKAVELEADSGVSRGWMTMGGWKLLFSQTPQRDQC